VDPKILPDLLIFLEVVRSGSITRAAQRLNTVQSNVTARMRKLEDALGTALLKRLARGVKPTPAGEALAQLAQRLDAVLDDLRFTFGGGSEHASSKLRIGAIETVLASHLPPVVAAFSRLHPRIDVSVRTGSSLALVKQLREGELDAAFVSRPTEIRGLRERVAFRDELVLVESKATRTAQKPWLREGAPFNVLVQRLGCSYTERLLATIGKAPRRSYRVLELGTLEGVLGFVEAGLGVAALPKAFIEAAGFRRRLALAKLPPRTRELQTYLIMPPAAESAFAGNAFFELLGGYGRPPG
jgi:DNA-binding transcriptional LysR family regulator